MDFNFTPEQDAFRTEVRTWLAAALPPGWGETVHEPAKESDRAAFKRDWDRQLYQAGWAGIAWPREYGGRGATLVEQAIFLEEMARARAPEGLIGSVVSPLGLALRMPDHTTLSQRAASLEVPGPRRPSAGAGGDAEPVHLLVDSTGLKLCGAGEWMIERSTARKLGDRAGSCTSAWTPTPARSWPAR